MLASGRYTNPKRCGDGCSHSVCNSWARRNPGNLSTYAQRPSSQQWRNELEVHRPSIARHGYGEFNDIPKVNELFQSSLSLDSASDRTASGDSGIEVMQSVEEEESVPIDSTLEPEEIPSLSDQLLVIQQVEYYFSDDYLARDAYFLRQIRRKREGYLSIKLITNFKKLRKIVKDPRVTAFCLRNSMILQVNEEGTKVKRIEDVPEDLKRFQAQNSILVIGVPEHLAKIEAVTKIFYKCGDMTSVRIVKPGKECPMEILEHLERRDDRSIWNQVNAVIEYDKPESAMAACRFLEARRIYGISKVCLLAAEARIKRVYSKEDKGLSWRNGYSSLESRKLNPYDFNWRHHMQAAESLRPISAMKKGDNLQRNEKEESISDNAWVQDVVNQVLRQTYKSSKILSDYAEEDGSASGSSDLTSPGNSSDCNRFLLGGAPSTSK